MIKPKSICTICSKIKKDDCDRCKKKPFEGINRDNQRFYNSRKWRNKAKSHKARNPLCIECLAEGKTSLAEVTDHINPIDKGGDKFADSNLQSLCHYHHNKKTAKSRKV